MNKFIKVLSSGLLSAVMRILRSKTLDMSFYLYLTASSEVLLEGARLPRLSLPEKYPISFRHFTAVSIGPVEIERVALK